MRFLLLTLTIVGCAAPDSDAENVQHNHALPHTILCTEDCDCFDDNACTADACLNGRCLNEPTNGYCGSTVGMCRGTSCCASEYTCFRAYDIGNACEQEKPKPALSCAASPDETPCTLNASWEGACRGGLCCWSCIDEAPSGGACPFETPDGALVNGQCVTGRCFQSWDNELQPWVCR